MIFTREQLLAQLQQSEFLARSSAFSRWMHQPLKYVWGMTISKLLFPAFSTTVRSRAKTFFGTDMLIQLPAGLDIYLTHAKSHDSEIRLARWMINHLQSGQTFVDAGAHFGYFSLLANKLGCRVWSFEPTSATFELLSENTAAHSVHITQAGLANENEKVVFYTFKGSFSEYNSLSAEQYLEKDWFEKADCVEEHIQVIKLDDFCRNHQIVPDCIKIDVEGAEDNVVLSAEKLLRSTQPMVIMEYHPGNEKGPHAMAAHLLQQWGYMAHTISAEGYQQPCRDIESYLSEKDLDSDNLLFLKLQAIT
jgi:FkbM family methyltransferase